MSTLNGLLLAPVFLSALALAQEPKFAVLHAFQGGAAGQFPTDLVLDKSGNVYGIASTGFRGLGLVFQVDRAGKETVTHYFKGPPDGQNPISLTGDKTGAFYGVTASGGSHGAGTVFKLSPGGKQSILYNFNGAKRVGAFSRSGVVRDAKGNLYGAGTIEDGSKNVIFRLNSATKAEAVLHTFAGSPTDGDSVLARLLLTPSGDLYGTTYSGGGIAMSPACRGSSLAGDGCGTVFRLDSRGRESIIVNFTGGPDGAEPSGGLISDGSGNLYGAAASGGSTKGICGEQRSARFEVILGCGVLFKIDPAGKETVLYTFTGGADGAFPGGNLIRDEGGNLYGTASGGSDPDRINCGIVFRVDSSGDLTVLHRFTATDCFGPSGLVARNAGDGTYELYGIGEGGHMSSDDAPTGFGIIFKLTLPSPVP